MKPFNLEQVKKGASLITRGGKKARFIGFIENLLPDDMIVEIDLESGKSRKFYYRNGRYYGGDFPDSIFDLFIAE